MRTFLKKGDKIIAIDTKANEKLVRNQSRNPDSHSKANLRDANLITGDATVWVAIQNKQIRNSLIPS